MTRQEEIPYTKEEVEAMVKTIQQLRKEKKELLDKVCDWIKKESFYYIECEDHHYSGWLMDEFYTDLRKAMEN